jgi:hypothetical protein
MFYYSENHFNIIRLVFQACRHICLHASITCPDLSNDSDLMNRRKNILGTEQYEGKSISKLQMDIELKQTRILI